MTHDTELYEPVKAAMPMADDATVRIVAAIAGLLGAVAYVDGVYDSAEIAQIRRELQQIRDLGASGVRAIMQVLEDRLLHVATVDIARNARVLRELADSDLKREIVALLLRLAAADGSISSREVGLLRQLTGSLGLSQDDYTVLQARHRHLLEILRPPST